MCLLILLAAALSLDMQPDLWRQKNADAAKLSVSHEGLRVGAWFAGRYGPRFEYAKRIPVVRGMVLGRYRTEALYPQQAMVRIEYQAAEKTLSSRSYPLASAAEWTDFAIPVFRPPADANSIVVSFGLAEKTEGSVRFDRLRVTEEYVAPPFGERRPALTRKTPAVKLSPSKYPRVERVGGVWWLVKSDGTPFFSVASLTPGAREARDLFPEITRLGFNSLAGSHSVQRWAAFNEAQLQAGEPTLVQFWTLETRVGAEYETLVDAAGANPGASQAKVAGIGGFNHAFPDPFDPKWQESFRERVRKVAQLVRGKPYFGGWFADNERAHKDIHRYVWSPHSAAEFMRFLERKYPNIQALNTAWSTNFKSRDDLLRAKPDPAVRKGAMYEDFRLFSREIIRRFNQTVLRIIREEDPGRLVFSNRFMLDEIRDVLDNLDLYRDFDAIAVNIYPANIAPGLDPSERQMLELIHQRTGRPIVIGEWSVPALDSGLYDNPARLDWSYPQTVENQTQRARQAVAFLTDLYNLPFLVGAHWFTWNDYDSPTRQANRGLFKANGQPWVELQEALRRFNVETR